MENISQNHREMKRQTKKAKSERKAKLLETYEKRLKKQAEASKRWKLANSDKVAAQQARYYARKAQELAFAAAEAHKMSVVYHAYLEDSNPVQAATLPNGAPVATITRTPEEWAEYWKDKLETPAINYDPTQGVSLNASESSIPLDTEPQI